MLKILFTLLSILIISILYAQPSFEQVGFSTQNGGTTGGQGGLVVTVNNYNDLKTYAQSSNKYIIMVEGEIYNGTGGGQINVSSNKSIIGVGNTAYLHGIGLGMSSGDNIIVQNIKFSFVGMTSPTSINGGDCISISGTSNNIWIDHCEFFSEDPNVQTNVDKYDGLMDIKHQTGFITVSWCYFHDHHKCGLVGSADDDLFENRKVTYHHNYYRNIKYRMPMYRGSTGHFFNNYLSDIVDASEIRAGTCVRMEKNYYENFHYAIYTPSESKGYVEMIDNYLDGTQSRAYPGSCTANIPYSYSSVLTTNAQDVKSLVIQYSGVGKIGEDCNGEILGGAFLDDCGTCVGGSSGKQPCHVDCNGVEDGTAILDECGVCSGGNTGVTPCPGAIQGEDFCTADGTADSNNPGYIGDGFLNLINASGSSVNWYITSTSAQTVTIEIRYANGESSARGMNVLINGAIQTSISGNVSGGWSNWISETVSLNLNQGVNTITLTATDDGGGPNIDALIFKSEGLSNGSCGADCNGVIGGSAYFDNCNICVGGNTGEIDCINKTIELKTGWNLVGYPHENSTDVSVALSSIWTYVEIIKDFEGFYLKDNPSSFNSLQQLYWGKGYWIKVNANCKLNWN